jgi:hypothetical protein
VSKLIRIITAFAIALSFGSAVASAQKGPDVFIGVGTAMDSSSQTFIDTFGDGNLIESPKLTGSFGKIGGDVMITPRFGFGAQTDFRFSQGDYAGLKYRPVFYDFNLIYTPTEDHFKKFVPEFQAGLGGAHLKYYFVQQSACDPFFGCSSSNSSVGSSKHFQLHTSAGLKIYATPHIFIRPQVDLRYVKNFFQFGSNWAPEYGGSVGYTFGER